MKKAEVYIWATKRRLKDRFNEHIRRSILNPPGSYIQTAVSEHFLSDSHFVSHMLLIPIERLRYERDCLRKAREAHLIHKAKTIEPLRMSTKDVPVKHIDACAYKMPSCCSVEAIKNTKLCKLYKGTKGFTNADPAWARHT